MAGRSRKGSVWALLLSIPILVAMVAAIRTIKTGNPFDGALDDTVTGGIGFLLGVSAIPFVVGFAVALTKKIFSRGSLFWEDWVYVFWIVGLIFLILEMFS